MTGRNRIKGITIEVGGDTTKLQSALKSVNSEIRSTQSQLKDVEKLLKLDPGNTELLAQRQKLLAQAVTDTKSKLDQLKQANEQVSASAKNYDAWKAKYDPIQKEIEETQTKLTELRKKSADADKQLSEGKISKEKYDALQAELKETEINLKDLKKRAKEVDDEFGRPINPRQYDALQREIIETTQELKNLERQVNDSEGAFDGLAAKGEKLKEIGSVVKEAGDKIEGYGQTMTTHVTAPIVAAGAASVAAWKEVDAGYDIVIRKTGAMGDATEELKGIVKDIASSIPSDFSTIGSAVGEVNTRFGLTGDALKDLSSEFVKFAELNSTDVTTSIDTTQKALAAYGLGAEDASGFLDRMNQVAQQTGVSTDKLASGIVSNATAFKEMGLDIDQATVFMGQLEKSGANSETVLNGMRKALKQATKDGKPLNVALQELQNTILNGTGSMDGLTASYDLFGKSGDQIYGAVKDGSIDFSNLATSVDSAAGSVATTFEATKDPINDLTTIMNELKTIGYDIVTSAGPMLVQVLTIVRDVVRDLSEKWNSLSASQQEMIIKAALIVAALGPVLIIIGKIVGAIGTVIGAIGSLMTAMPLIAAVISGVVIPAITGLIGTIVGVVIPAIASVLVALAPFLIGGAIIAGIIAAIYFIVKFVRENWDEIKKIVSEIVSTVKAKVGEIVNTVKTKAKEVWGNIKSIFSTIRQGFDNFIRNALNWGRDLIDNFIAGIRSKIEALWSTIRNVASGVRQYIGFSEPEKGPLSDFHTYAPDMMRLFMQGIRDYTPLIQNQLANAFSMPELDIAALSAAGPAEGRRGAVYETEPAGLARSAPIQHTTILQVDRTQLGRVVYELNNEETQRVGVNLAGGVR